MIGGSNKRVNAYSKIIKRVGVERQGIREDLETISAMQREKDMPKHKVIPVQNIAVPNQAQVACLSSYESQC